MIPSRKLYEASKKRKVGLSYVRERVPNIHLYDFVKQSMESHVPGFEKAKWAGMSNFVLKGIDWNRSIIGPEEWDKAYRFFCAAGNNAAYPYSLPREFNEAFTLLKFLPGKMAKAATMQLRERIDNHMVTRSRVLECSFWDIGDVVRRIAYRGNPYQVFWLKVAEFYDHSKWIEGAVIPSMPRGLLTLVDNG